VIRAEVVTNADHLFTRVEHAATQATQLALARSGAMLLTKIRANASTGHHRRGLPHIPGTGPGPNVATGDYRRSWHMTTLPDGSVVVATNAPQARRLEYGFVGVDAAGRSYNTPAYPHVRPSVEPTKDFMAAQMKTALAQEAR
jgi:hypothetical protein